MFPMDMSGTAFGELQDSNDCATDEEALKRRMAEDGYIFLRGFFDPNEVIKSRREVLTKLELEGFIGGTNPYEDAKNIKSRPFRKIDFDLAKLNAVRELTGSGRIMKFYRHFLGGEVISHDKFLVRVLSPSSKSDTAHCDIVYMGQGTRNLYTSWIPLGDIPLEQGPLMILEKSHLLENELSNYWEWDVDKSRNRLQYRHGVLFRGGHYSRNPPALQKEFGLRWLSANFQIGDVLIFSALTMHSALDNNSNVIRLSTDCRYQLASEPIDPRWVGESPSGNKPLSNDFFSKLSSLYRFTLRTIYKP